MDEWRQLPADSVPQSPHNELTGLIVATDVVGECITTALTSALQGVMGNEKSSASAVVTFL